MGLDEINSVGKFGYNENLLGTKNKSEKISYDSKIVIRDPKTGKVYIMTFAEYIKFLNRRQNQNNQQNQEPYELGPNKNGVRIIAEENVTDPLVNGTSAPNIDRTPQEEILEYETNLEQGNGVIDDFRQGKRGDCYLLATIESIKNTQDGQKILAKNVKANPNGSYTVTLPGAIAVRNNYIAQGYDEDKCAITGTYTITKEAVEKAKSLAGKSYAYGDIEVIVLELAMEAYRAEVNKTNEELGVKQEMFTAGQNSSQSDVDTLSSGFTYDAAFLLTGQKSELYEANKKKKGNVKYYIPGEYGYVGEEPKFVSKGYRLCGKKSGIVEINHLYNKDSDLQKMLDKYKGKESEYSLTVSFMVGVDGPDGTTKAGGGHALTVVAITDEYVEVVNPWDTKKHERIPRGDFEKMAYRFNAAPMTEKKVDKFYAENVYDNPYKQNFFEKFVRDRFGWLFT